MSRRVAIFISVAFGVMIFVMAVLYQTMWYGEIKLSGADAFKNVSIDGEYVSRDSGTVTRLRPGTYRLKATGPRVTTILQDISVSGLQTKTIELKPVERDVADIIEQTGSGGSRVDFTVLRSAFFENDTWLAANVVATDANVEGSSLVYRFMDGAWVIQESGTGMEEDDYEKAGFPDSVIAFLLGENQ